MDATQIGEDGKYLCPYGCEKTYARVDNLEEHILTSKVGVQGIDEHHEAGKIADGWYNEDFKEDKRSTATKEKRKSYQRQIEGFLPVDQHDQPQLRYVDDDAQQAVTVGGGLSYILKNAMAIAKQAEHVNRMTEAFGLTTGHKPTVDQLNQLSKVASRPINANNPKPLFKSGQGFDPQDFRQRLVEPPRSARNRFAQATVDEQTFVQNSSFADWIPQFDDVELQGLVTAAVDLVESEIPEADMLAKGVRLYKHFKESYSDALQQGDDELAENYSRVGSTIRDHMTEHGADVDEED